MFGLLNIHKPSGITSRQVVDVVQRLVRPHKAGHAGTLDPLASGVLVVGVGRATRLTQYVQRMSKQYRATFLLGRSSETEDIEGQVHLLDNPPQPGREEIEQAAAALTGQIEQCPPAYSALKLGGKRAYQLARAGKAVELAPRMVTIYQLDVLRYDYPELEVNIRCSGGTYVRSLGRDLARRGGSEAVMAALVRTAIGEFTIENAVVLDALNAENLQRHLIPPLAAVALMPHVRLSADQQQRVSQGQFLDDVDCSESECAALDEQGALVAILERRPNGSFGPRHCFG
jgi:tRNA pseudouridine55 synthase